MCVCVCVGGGGGGSFIHWYIVCFLFMSTLLLHFMYCNLIGRTAMGAWPILRGCWFEVLGDKWYPILEVEHLLIEAAHTDKTWREKVG